MLASRGKGPGERDPESLDALYGAVSIAAFFAAGALSVALLFLFAGCVAPTA